MIDDDTIRWVMYTSLIVGSVATYYANKQWRRDQTDKTIMRLAMTMFTVMIINIGLILTNIWAINEPLLGVIVLVEAYHVVITIRLYRLIALMPRKANGTNTPAFSSEEAVATPAEAPSLRSNSEGVADV